MLHAGRTILIGTALALLAGCDNRHVLGSAGESDGGSGGAPGSPGGGGQAGGVVVDAAFGNPGTGGTRVVGALGSTQTWTGYVENYTFRSGSDALNFTFATDAAGNVVGTIALGMGTPPPPATDPNTGYPPGYQMGQSFSYIAEGFPYPMENGTLVGNRLRFEVLPTDLWAGWCALQTPPADGGGFCLPNWGGGSNGTGYCWQTDPTTHQMVTRDCLKLDLCALEPVCSCSATACAPRAIGGMSFDIALTANDGNGSLMGIGNVRLTRVDIDGGV
jgi:hypothetical protein